MKKLLALYASASILCCQAPAPLRLTGFSDPAASEQLEREKQFDASMNRADLQSLMERLSAKPHHLGSPADKENAEFIAAQFRSWGYDTAIETFYPLFPTPKLRRVEMTQPRHYVAKLEEPILPEDKTSGIRQDQLPVYNAFSIDGDVTAPLVYVNYGVPADYEILAEHGIDVKGKIVIARYGHSWRGIKPKVAAEHGAVGCLIYSDPRDDGYFQGDSYPKGGWRPAYGAQRGSVLDAPVYPGDPLTPGIGATKDAPRLPREKAETITKIPVLPISYADATAAARGASVDRPGAAAISGSAATHVSFGSGSRGGASGIAIRLETDPRLRCDRAPARRRIGRRVGDPWESSRCLGFRRVRSAEWAGADDGRGAQRCRVGEGGLEAPAFHRLHNLGWRRADAAWFHRMGRAACHRTDRACGGVYQLRRECGRGTLEMGGSHTLEHFVNEAARDVIDPERKVSTLDRYRAASIVSGTPEEKQFARDKQDFSLEPLGTGSDYTPFLQHLGIAALNIGFGGESASDGSYHSIYDSYDHYTKFDDPDFQYAVALAQLGGRLTMRLADAQTLPVRFDGFVRAVAGYLDELVKMADTMRKDTEDRNRSIADHTFELAADPRVPFIAPVSRVAVPYLNFAPLENAIAGLRTSARAFEDQEQRAASPLPLNIRKQLDQIFIQCDRALLRPEGLPRRPWYKHQIYAPGFYTGYDVKTIPGVREAIEERRWDDANAQIPIVAQSVQAMAEQIDRATALTR